MSTAFWDASALIPLFVQEPATVACKQFAAQHPCTVWWGTPVEIRSAFARRNRSGILSDVHRIAALARLAFLAQSWQEIAPGYRLREFASDLLDIYALRAADSLQLAAALTWCNRRPAGRVFLCSDQRLADAADLAGFTVLRPGISAR